MHTVTVMQAASNFTMILVSLAAVADLTYTVHGIIVTMDNKHNVTSTSAACVC